MASSIPLDNIDPSEKHLSLPGNRRLAYSQNGDPSSSVLVIFFHGVFGVGNAVHLSPVLQTKGVHYVAPTLPGWGTSSTRPRLSTFASELTADITALINHLHPNDPNLRLYVGGGSYGTVPAQILYGASFEVFPLGRHLKGCFLMAPFSPLKYHQNPAKYLGAPDYTLFALHYVPFRLIPRWGSFAMKNRLDTSAKAVAFIRQTLFDKMGEEEKASFKQWAESHGRKDEDVINDFGENARKSVATSWEGFMEVGDNVYEDWGFQPAHLDDAHNRRPILIVTATEDDLADSAMAKWLTGSHGYVNSKLKLVPGGHLGAMLHLDDIFTEVLVDE